MAAKASNSTGGYNTWRYARFLVVFVLIPYVLIALPACERAAEQAGGLVDNPVRAQFASSLFLIIGGLVLLGAAGFVWQGICARKLQEARAFASFDMEKDLDACKKDLAGLPPLAVSLVDNLHPQARDAIAATLLELEQQGIIELGEDGLKVDERKHAAPKGKKTVAQRRTSLERRVAARKPADELDPLDDVLTPSELFLVRALESGSLDEGQLAEWEQLAEEEALETPALKDAMQKVGSYKVWRGGWLQGVVLLAAAVLLIIMTVVSSTSQEAFAAAQSGGASWPLSVLVLFAANASNLRSLLMLSVMMAFFLEIMRNVLAAKNQRDLEGVGASSTCMRTRRGERIMEKTDGLKSCLASYENLSEDERSKLDQWSELPIIARVLAPESQVASELAEHAGLSSWDDII